MYMELHVFPDSGFLPETPRGADTDAEVQHSDHWLCSYWYPKYYHYYDYSYMSLFAV